MPRPVIASDHLNPLVIQTAPAPLAAATAIAAATAAAVATADAAAATAAATAAVDAATDAADTDLVVLLRENRKYCFE